MYFLFHISSYATEWATARIIRTLDLCRTSDTADCCIACFRCDSNETTAVRPRCPTHAAASCSLGSQTAPQTLRSAGRALRRTTARFCTCPAGWAVRECGRPSRRWVARARRSSPLADAPAPPAFPSSTALRRRAILTVRAVYAGRKLRTMCSRGTKQLSIVIGDLSTRRREPTSAEYRRRRSSVHSHSHSRRTAEWPVVNV